MFDFLWRSDNHTVAGGLITDRERVIPVRSGQIRLTLDLAGLTNSYTSFIHLWLQIPNIVYGETFIESQVVVVGSEG